MTLIDPTFENDGTTWADLPVFKMYPVRRIDANPWEVLHNGKWIEVGTYDEALAYIDKHEDEI